MADLQRWWTDFLLVSVELIKVQSPGKKNMGDLFNFESGASALQVLTFQKSFQHKKTADHRFHLDLKTRVLIKPF